MRARGGEGEDGWVGATCLLAAYDSIRYDVFTFMCM